MTSDFDSSISRELRRNSSRHTHRLSGTLGVTPFLHGSDFALLADTSLTPSLHTSVCTLFVGLKHFDLSRLAHQAQLKGELHHGGCRLHSASHAVLRNVKTHSSAAMFAVYLLSDPNGPPTAFLLFRPQCTVDVLALTHWGALRCPCRMASGTKRQQLSAAPLHCCCTAEPVLRGSKRRKSTALSLLPSPTQHPTRKREYDK